jgi:hypothetical protein
MKCTIGPIGQEPPAREVLREMFPSLLDEDLGGLSDMISEVYAKGHRAGQRCAWMSVMQTAVDQIHPAGWEHILRDETAPGGHR